MTRRWRIVLPVLHVIFAAIWIIPEDVLAWKYLPKMQAAADYERSRPTSSDSDWEASLDYEYRASLAGRAIHFVTPIPGLFLGSEHPLQPSENRLFLRITSLEHLGLKTQRVLVDGSLVFLIGVEWYLIGKMLDTRPRQKTLGSLHGRPAIVITVLGGIAAICAILYVTTSPMSVEIVIRQESEMIGTLSVFLAFLTWLIWLVLSAGKFLLTLSSRFFNSEVSAQ